MATNLALDDKLLDEAMRVGGKATKKTHACGSRALEHQDATREHPVGQER